MGGVHEVPSLVLAVRVLRLFEDEGYRMKPKPPTAAEVSRVMSALGKRTSAAKKAASAENGKKGGRPKGKKSTR